MRDNSIKFDIFVFIFLAVLVFSSKLPTLNTPYLWDEFGRIGGARWLCDAKFGLFRFIPGLYPPGMFDDHLSCGQHLSVAFLFKLFGKSIWLSHLFTVCVSFLGVYFTYLLGSLLYGRKVGFFSALFLFFSPVYFAQSGMLLGDLPVAALSAMCVYFTLRKKYIPYLLCSIYMVLIKETGILVVFAILVYLLLSEGNKTRYVFKEILKYGIPLLVIFSLFIIQKFAIGKLLYFPVIDVEFGGLIKLRYEEMILTFLKINKWIFWSQCRYVFTLLILLNFILNKNWKNRKEFLLFLLIFIFSGYTLSFFYYGHRYLFPVLPYFYIIGALALVELIKSEILQNIAAGIIILVLILSPFVTGFKGSGEFDMKYLDIVKLEKTMCQYIEKEFPAARILTAWPQTSELEDPFFGYVEKPLKIIYFDGKNNLTDFDVILFSNVPSGDHYKLKNYIINNSFKLIKQFKTRNLVSELYGH